MQQKYSFLAALRPFSFSVALITCLVGIVSSTGSTPLNGGLAAIVLLAAVVLQAGVNLINDYSDLQWVVAPQLQQKIRRNFSYGLACFLLSAALGLYLVALLGMSLLMLLLLGLIGALGYTLEPINFKRRGLAVVLVFWLMGVLMVCGSYYVMVGYITWQVFWQALPVSLISSLLLLANEIRDWQSDQQQGIATLTVRIGFQRAVLLYRLAALAVFLIPGLLWFSGYISALWWLLALPGLWLMFANLDAEQALRNKLPPVTGRFFLLFGILYTLSL